MARTVARVWAGVVNGRPSGFGTGFLVSPRLFLTNHHVLGDPRVALTWLANELSRLGIPLAAGQLVTTGTCVIPMAIAPGDRVRGDFGSLGAVSVRMGKQP